MSPEEEHLAPEVRHLYWETEASVGEIAGNLGISRRTLYELLLPWPAGAPCPACGGELTYVNRSARTAGEAVCGSCGAPQDLAILRELSADAGSMLRQEAERRERNRGDAGPNATAHAGPGPEGALEPRHGERPLSVIVAVEVPLGAAEELPLAAEPEVEQLWRASRLAPVGTRQALRRAKLLALGATVVAGLAAGVIAGLLAARR